jgi:rubredoxin
LKNLFKYCIVSGLLDSDVDSQIDKYIRNIGNEWNCTECGKSAKNRIGLRRHIEAQHIVSPGFQCDICGFVSKTRHALRGHKDYNHKMNNK